MPRTSHTLIAIAPVIVAAGIANAATLTFYNTEPEFLAATSSHILEDWDSVSNGSNYNDEFINAVHGETVYEVTAPPGWSHQVWNGEYNARNSSFRLHFDQTSITTGGGVHALSLLYANYDTVWVVFIRYADQTTEEFPLPPGTFDQQAYLAFSSDVPIESVHLCLTGDVPGISNGTIWLDELTVAAPPPPPCLGDLDGDNDTDVLDFATFATAFGSTVPPNTSGDYDGDGAVTVFDFTIFAADFGCGSN